MKYIIILLFINFLSGCQINDPLSKNTTSTFKKFNTGKYYPQVIERTTNKNNAIYSYSEQFPTATRRQKISYKGKDYLIDIPSSTPSWHAKMNIETNTNQYDPDLGITEEAKDKLLKDCLNKHLRRSHINTEDNTENYP